jgi:hypothetical protein
MHQLSPASNISFDMVILSDRLLFFSKLSFFILIFVFFFNVSFLSPSFQLLFRNIFIQAYFGVHWRHSQHFTSELGKLDANTYSTTTTFARQIQMLLQVVNILNVIVL